MTMLVIEKMDRIPYLLAFVVGRMIILLRRSAVAFGDGRSIFPVDRGPESLAFGREVPFAGGRRDDAIRRRRAADASDLRVADSPTRR